MKTKTIEEMSAQMKRKSDLIINNFIFGFFIIGLLLASCYDTWLIAIGVGGLSLVAYFSTKSVLPGSNLYQYVLSAVMGIFMAQFIYQMHGMFEMHFFAFIGSAILVTYRNWKLQIPLAIVVLIHHAAFGYLQFVGFDKVYFSQLEYMTLQTFIIHIMLSISIFCISGLWAYNFRISGEKNVQKSFEIGRLQQESSQKDALIAMSENLTISNRRLKDMHNELAKIFDTIEEVLFSMDTINNNIIQISVACTKVYGYTPAEFIDDNDLWLNIIHPDDKHVIKKNKDELQEGRTVTNKYRVIHKNGGIRWVETKTIPTFNEKGLLIRVDGICNDITQKIKLEARLVNEKNQKQHQITEAIITAQENERSFLGEELHDNINPTLATVKLYLDCAIADENKRADLLKDSKGFVTTAMNDIRTLSKSLVPPSLGEIGLTDAITDMIGNIKLVNDLDFITKWEGIDENLLPGKLKLTIFRIVQEQLNNIFKHSKAKAVFIGLKQNGTELELNIKDDGIGFEVTQKKMVLACRI